MRLFSPEYIESNAKICIPKDKYIIAEIGINHNGDMEIAKKLIDMASEAGL